jgi:hypothetical protein
VSLFDRRAIRPSRRGSYVVDLGPDERAVLGSLPAQMREALASRDDPSLRRLFPPAYAAPEDRDKQDEFARLMEDDLLAGHQEALGVLESTASAVELTAEQLDGWLRALNSIRLLLGTRLEVTEDDDADPSESPAHALYYFLGYLQECGIDALSGGSGPD